MFDKNEYNPWMLLSVLLIGGILGYTLSMVGSSASDFGGTVGDPVQDVVPEDSAPQVVNVSLDDDPALGDPNAPIVVVEFSNFQCGYCKRFSEETLPLIKENYIDTGLVYFVYRDYPAYTNGPAASEAGECADEQGEFFAMHDAIFSGFNEWASAEDPLPLFSDYASSIGLDVAAFNACMETGAVREEIANDYEEGRSYGVQATPTFFINGQRVVGAHPYETFSGIFDQILAQ